MAQLIDTNIFGDLTVTGNLTIQGTTTTLDTSNLAVTDNIIIINNGEVGAGITLGTAGIDIDRGSETNAQFLFDDSIDLFTTNFGLNVGGAIKENGTLLSTLYSGVSHTHTFASLTSKPTTISGYGITDAVEDTDVLYKTVTANFGTGGPDDNLLSVNGQNVGAFGQLTAHGDYTDFDTEPAVWGWSYVQGTLNSPHSESQGGYRARIGLGDTYSNYAMELNITRQLQTGSDHYLYLRQLEANVWSSWFKLDAGNADTVNDLTVLTAVPSGAVFTDTTYTNLSEFTNDTNFITTASVTYGTLDTNGDVGTGSGQLAIGDHNHLYATTTALTSADDLDTITTNGFYKWADTAPTNAPSGTYHNMIIQSDGGQPTQMVWGGTTGGEADISIRRRDSGTWNSWTHFSTTSHTHSTWDRATSVLAGATVFSDIIVTDGITTGISTRDLTLANLGYTGATDANNYIHATRNCVINQDPVTQATSTRTGMSSTIYNGNDTNPRSIDAGLIMYDVTLDYGGLVWIKNYDAVTEHSMFDTVRGATKRIASSSTAIEDISNVSGYVSGFTSTGFEVDTGTTNDAYVNEGIYDYVAWSFQTNRIATGLTNHNKAYTCHYNSNMGFSIINHLGDFDPAHEIPHHLGRPPELSLFKNRDTVSNWVVSGKYIGNQEAGDFLQLDSDIKIATTISKAVIVTDTTLSINASLALNNTNENTISYHFASVPGVSKIGNYIGTGAAGNFIECGFKPGFVIIKNISTNGNGWLMIDSMRGDNYVFADTTAANAALDILNFVDNGFDLIHTGDVDNGLNEEYVFMAFAETNSDTNSSWADYSYPTTADTIDINADTLISVANGYDAYGQVDTIHNFAGTESYVFGTGEESTKYWLYSSNTGTLGVTDVRPLETWNDRNEADKWGEQAPLDITLRTTDRHYGYSSSTGVASASAESAGGHYAWNAFNKDHNQILTSVESRWLVNEVNNTTNDIWVQYKQTEKRILKSWRFREDGVTSDRTPGKFTIQGSNDGYAWTAIDSTYTTTLYTVAGAGKWGNLHIPSNTTAYLYHRIFITENSSDGTYTGIAEMEFNTILPADYYLAEEGKTYIYVDGSADTTVERVYLAEVITDSDGDITSYTSLPVAKQKLGETEIHKDLTVHGDIINKLSSSAVVRFKGTQTPPLKLMGEHIYAIVDLGVGKYKLIGDNTFDMRKCTIIPACLGIEGSSRSGFKRDGSCWR